MLKTIFLIPLFVVYLKGEVTVMKTINWSKFNFKDFEEKKRSSERILPEILLLSLGEK